MKLLLSVCIVVAALAVRAEVVVFKMTQSGTVLGDTNSVHQTMTGYVVIDPESGEFQLIDSYAQGKSKIYELESWPVEWFRIQGVKGKPYTGFRVFASDTNGTQIVTIGTGADAATKISATNIIQMPHTFTAKPQSSSVDADSGVVWDSTLTMSFSSTDTLKANAEGLTVSNFVAQIQAGYVAKGYTLNQ